MLGLGLGIIEACVWIMNSGKPTVFGPTQPYTYFYLGF